MQFSVAQPAAASQAPLGYYSRLPAVIAAIGTDGLGTELLAYFSEVTDVRQVAVYCVSDSSDLVLLAHAGDGSHPTKAPRIAATAAACGTTGTIVREAGMMAASGKTTLNRFVVTLSSGPAGIITGQQEDLFASSLVVIFASLDRHIQMTDGRHAPQDALRSLKTIEECCLGSSAELSPREGAVCARIVYGMTAYGIAIDLGIGEESVSTYRKRAYRRLGIGCQRELLMWYLAQWDQARRRSKVRQLQLAA